MLMFRNLWVAIAAATVLVGVLLSAPAFAQAHIRGTLTAAKDGTIRPPRAEWNRSNSPTTPAFSW
jgi:hypothetical protein